MLDVFIGWSVVIGMVAVIFWFGGIVSFGFLTPVKDFLIPKKIEEPMTTEQVLREIVRETELMAENNRRMAKTIVEYKHSLTNRIESTYDEYVEEPVSSVHSFRENNPWLSTFLLARLNTLLEQKYGYKMEPGEKALLLTAFYSASNETMFDIETYVKKHPFVSAYLFDRFITLYHEKQQRGERVNLMEVKMFLFTASLFDV